MMLMPVCSFGLLIRGRILTSDAGVIEDAKFKRREALADLAKAVGAAKK